MRLGPRRRRRSAVQVSKEVNCLLIERRPISGARTDKGCQKILYATNLSTFANRLRLSQALKSTASFLFPVMLSLPASLATRARSKKDHGPMVEIEGEAMRGVTWVRVHEVASGNWGIGGKALTRRRCEGTPNSRQLNSRTVQPPLSASGPHALAPVGACTARVA